MLLNVMKKMYKKIFILPVVGCTFFAAGTCFVYAVEREIEPLFMELDKKYKIPDTWKELPFELEDPYKRIKNGPILTNVIYKANVEWISKWIANPKAVVPNAKMPDLGLEFEEIKAIIAYLGSIGEKNYESVEWDKYLLKPEDDMTDDEWFAMDEIFANGKGVWSRARCTICHPVKGKGGQVGVGPDLGEISTKINRDWLYSWLANTKEHFPDTMMAQYRYTDSEIRGLVEFIMRDYQFKPEEGESEAEGEESQILTQAAYKTIKGNSDLIEKGKNVIEKARCFVCHKIEGFSELMPVAQKERDNLEGFKDVLYEIRCLTCHTIQRKGGTYAPNLTMVGSKIKMDWENDFLRAPDIIRPLSQQMPKFNLTAEDATHATDFMDKYLTNDELPEGFFEEGKPSKEVVEAGREIFYNKGCDSCHAEGMQGGGVVGPNLGTVGDRLQPSYMAYHLKNPQLVIPDAIEPNYGLSDEEIKKLVGFLVAHVKDKEGKK